MTRTSTPDSVSFRRFLPFSPWRAPASLQRNVARQHRREYADSARLRLKNQKSLENTSLAGALQFCRSRNVPRQEKGPQRILAVLSRGLTQYGRISARQNRVCPCRSMVRSLYHIFRRGTTVLWKVMPGSFSAGGRKLSGKKRISASFLV